MKGVLDAVSAALFGRSIPTSRMLFGTGAHDFDIVGESFYQDALEALAGGRHIKAAHVECVAFMAPEPDNSHDETAVVVTIERRKVGHFGREHSRAVLRRLEELGIPKGASCRALICGGWDEGCGDTGDFGVKLDIVWPLCLAPK
ncbi:MAG: hypothetical protein WA926_04405 [Methylovirgula sp.]